MFGVMRLFQLEITAVAEHRKTLTAKCFVTTENQGWLNPRHALASGYCNHLSPQLDPTATFEGRFLFFYRRFWSWHH